MLERCSVKKVKRGVAYIELVRSEKCDGCNMCSFNKKKSMTVPALCDADVRPGDIVSVEMPTKSVGAAALAIYAIPIVLMLLGALIGIVGGVWLQVGLVGAGLAAGLFAAFLIDRAYRKKAGVMPRIVAVLEKSGAIDTSDAVAKTDVVDGENQ